MSVKKTKHGDTIVEVCICITIFALVAIVNIGLMNNGLNTAQRTLEVTMARTAMDSQAEALRFIHNNYLSERNFTSGNMQFKKIWDTIKSLSRNTTNSGTDAQLFDINNAKTCADAYKNQVDHYSAFVVNPRLVVPDIAPKYRGYQYAGNVSATTASIMDNMLVSGKDGANRLKTASLYPRIIYSTTPSSASGLIAADDDSTLKNDNEKLYQFINRAEGIWVIAVFSNQNDKNRSEYFDFYIRTCWQAAGTTAPSTITTIMRLYNPEVIQE